MRLPEKLYAPKEKQDCVARRGKLREHAAETGKYSTRCRRTLGGNFSPAMRDKNALLAR
jgi:hypothetical protein